uniref:Uncharacterized protein n=1 Tax=Heterorhabditis bacteriophora TaxID=37862 RepID=A0A1I7XHJ3_HETBA
MIWLKPATIALFLICTALAYDKNLLKKGKKSNTYEKHPISRRVLRFERSADNFPRPEQLLYPLSDYAKTLPDLPIKYKPSNVLPDVDYQPDIEF